MLSNVATVGPRTCHSLKARKEGMIDDKAFRQEVRSSSGGEINFMTAPLMVVRLRMDHSTHSTHREG